MKSIFKSVLLSSMAIAALSACDPKPASESSELTLSGLNPADFDTCVAVAYDYETGKFVADSANAKQVNLYTLKNENGMEVCITNFGGRIVSIMVPNKEGKMVDVVCGFDNIADYLPWNHTTDYGTTVGRYANRIDGGQFEVNGETVTLDKNNDGHACLHGGYTGWQYKVFDVLESSENTLVLCLKSPDGDNKFPGNVEVAVKFELTADNGITIDYEGKTDAATVLNMTNHSYINLSGDMNNTVEESVLQINADYYTPADEFYIPTGEVKSVEGTVFDFREPKAIGTHFAEANPEIEAANGGYDHNWCMNAKGDRNEVCITLSDPRSGIKLDMYTNEPGVQVYTGNFQDGSCVGKGGVVYKKQCAICLESQKYPDSPNKYKMAGWELSDPFITPEKTYQSYCKWVFSVEK